MAALNAAFFESGTGGFRSSFFSLTFSVSSALSRLASVASITPYLKTRLAGISLLPKNLLQISDDWLFCNLFCFISRHLLHFYFLTDLSNCFWVRLAGAGQSFLCWRHCFFFS